MLKVYVRHGMIVEKFHEIKLIKQSKWLEKYINFNTMKKNIVKKDLEKAFYKLLNNTFYGKTNVNLTRRNLILMNIKSA